jgi:hypothetical protein
VAKILILTVADSSFLGESKPYVLDSFSFSVGRRDEIHVASRLVTVDPA